MFGDVGHGGVLFLVSTVLCLMSDFLKRVCAGNGAVMGILSLRYILLLMGFFALFCGLMYNDFVAIPLFIFDSCYTVTKLDDAGKIGAHGELEFKYSVFLKRDCTYPVGIDPAWYLGKNELQFLNSLKMKLSVIFGVL